MKKLDKCDSSNDVDAVMEKYRKERKRNLMYLATTTIADVMIVLGFKKAREKISDLEKQAETQKKQIDRLKASNRNYAKKAYDKQKENRKLKQENDILKEKDPVKKAGMVVSDTGENISRSGVKFSGTVDGIKKIASAKTEVFSNAAKDCLNEVKDAAQNVNKATGKVSKGSAIVKGAANIAGVVKDTANGTAEEGVRNSKQQEMKKNLLKLRNSIGKARGVMKTAEKGSPEYKRAEAYVTKYMPIYDKKKYEYSTFTKSKK